MFKPRAMTRTIIIGPKNSLEKTIELLHSMEVAHIIDFFPNDKEEGFQLGSPTGNASEVSEKLLKLRSSVQILEIDKEKVSTSATIPVKHVVKDLDLKVQTIELNILSAAEAKTRIEEHLKKIDERIRHLQPFVDLNIPLENYQGYEHVVVYTGYVRDIKKLENGLAQLTNEYELFHTDDVEKMVALFIAKDFRDQAIKILTECGYSEIKLPEGTGFPIHFIEKWNVQYKELFEKIEKTKADLLELRKKHADFILASEEYLSIEVQKAEAPVRFATTAHSFVIDCWIPQHDVMRVKQTLEKESDGSLYIETFTMEHDDEPPVLLNNPKPVRSFEFLLDLYSTPNYRDIDPSFVLSLIFPLFFGLMIGDMGYGLLLILVGIIFMKKFKDSEGFYNIGWYIIIAGIFATIFGLFLFGDMFGLAFQSAAETGHATTYTWSSLLGVTIPIHSIIDKMDASGLTQLLILSIIAGSLHIGLGLLFGVISERKHNRKHAISKLGLLCILLALVFIIFGMAQWTLGLWLEPLKQSAFYSFIWPYIITPLKAGITFGGLLIPYATIILGIIGLLVILTTIGGIGLIEMLEVTGHLISYTRLAALCVAKGALAFAFNVIGLGLILGGNIVFGVIGIVVVVLLQLIVFSLGSLSSGIQALRLHYVEFFMKFYKGGGIKFTPFGYIRKYTTRG